MAIVTALIAISKDRGLIRWFLFGLLTGPLALIAALIVGSSDNSPFQPPLPKPDLSDEAFERWLVKEGFASSSLKPDRLTELHEWFVQGETRRARR